jgi:redox-sensitive bicupin YhaK (pirin superfamily)
MISLRKSNQRGHSHSPWLDCYHTFSFADYYDPQHMGFRSLRVLNEDRLGSEMGFDECPRHDFEIVTYVVDGALTHKDSLGHFAVISSGGIQRMSAGIGVRSSEYNHSSTEPVHFLEMWIQPARKRVVPHYAHVVPPSVTYSALTLSCSLGGRWGTLRLNQDVDIYVGRLGPGESTVHPMREWRHAWVQLITGDLEIKDNRLQAGDGAALQGEPGAELRTENGAHFLLFDLC